MKNKQIITWVLIIAGLFGFLYWAGNNSISDAQKEPIEAKEQSVSVGKELAASEQFYDFGTISMKNGNVSKMFKVINGTEKDILFPNLTTSCMCTEAFFVEPDGSRKGPFGMQGMGFVTRLNKVIKAGGSAEIEVIYDPNAHGPAGVGRIDRFVYLEGENGEKLQFEIRANVTP